MNENSMNTEKELNDVRIEKPSWRRWPIVFLFSLYGCHYSFQVSFQMIGYALVAAF